jgi:hypothetical protein
VSEVPERIQVIRLGGLDNRIEKESRKFIQYRKDEDSRHVQMKEERSVLRVKLFS